MHDDLTMFTQKKRVPVVLRRLIALSLFVGCMVLTCSSALGLNPALDVSQYTHTSWKIRDGFVKGQIVAIAQTQDGYLWLGTELGLMRFDGVRSTSWQPPTGQSLPSDFIFSLLVSRDGTLWIGTAKGLASWKDGKFSTYPQLNGKYIFKIVEDHQGTIWIGATGVPNGKLCSIQSGNTQCFGEDGSLGRGAFNLFDDSKGNLWVGVERGLWHWQPGPPKRYELSQQDGFPELISEADDGTLLISTYNGIQQFVKEKIVTYSFPGLDQLRAQRHVRDRDGGSWFATLDRGLIHVYGGRADSFGAANGLTSNTVAAIFEDHEGNIWVATASGLDRFKESTVPLFDVRQGLSVEVVSAILADNKDTLWLGTFHGLNKLNKGQVEMFGANRGNGDGKVNGKNPQSIFQDHLGRIWITTSRDFGYVEEDRFRSIGRFAGGNSLAIGEDKSGGIWITNEQLGLFHVFHDNEVEQIPWASLGHKDHVSSLVGDPIKGGVWIGFFLGGIGYLADGKIQSSYSVAEGLGGGRVGQLRFDQTGALWVSTEGGLSRLKNNRVATLNSQAGLPCDAVHWSIEDNDHALWLYTSCGLVRITRTELDGWISAIDQDKNKQWTIKFTLFDSSDGVRIISSPGHYSPQVAKTSDGRIWFLPTDGVNVIDPHHLAFNSLPPPVHIEQLTADRKTYDAIPNGTVRLPPLIRDLQIDFTALSLAAPEKILFRYKLEPRDHDWQEVTTRRQAFYNDLPPGDYRLRVIGCNNSGVWNENGTYLDFSIAPAYYQTTWFRLLLVAIFLLSLVFLNQLRVRQVAARVRTRMEERLEERERIARDLHDTLLQSVQGLILKFDAGLRQVRRDDPARKPLEEALDQADTVLAEGRDRVWSLRKHTESITDLGAAFQRVVEQTPGSDKTKVKTVVEGIVRELHPLVLEESYSIGREALVNALTHSHGSEVELEITYDSRQFRLRIRDNGRGLDPQIMKDGRPGHWGLQGMRERAHKIGGQFNLWSRRETGTEVELIIPGAAAYQVARSRSIFSWFRRSSRIEDLQQ